MEIRENRSSVKREFAKLGVGPKGSSGKCEYAIKGIEPIEIRKNEHLGEVRTIRKKINVKRIIRKNCFWETTVNRKCYIVH